MSMDNLAFVFSGQGSQKVGMLANLAKEYSIVEKTFAEASHVLGYDTWNLIQNGEQDDLNLTEKTQPLLLTASIALWRVWNYLDGAKPVVMAGHSLGEYSALVAAEVMTLADAVKLVQLRGKFMQAAVPKGEGSMAAIIGLNDETITQACRDAALEEVVAPVNFNSPGQVVIAGNTEAVSRAIALCKEAGAKKALPLPVSAPFHTDLMKPAAQQLKPYIDETQFNPPVIPVVHNVHAKTEADPEKIKTLLYEQIYLPVQWVACVEDMVQKGVGVTVECGPGRVLCGLNKRIAKTVSTYAIEEPENMKKTVQDLA